MKLFAYITLRFLVTNLFNEEIQLISVILLKLPIIEGEFIKRINRFVGLVRIRGEVKKALITNTGRLEEFMIKGRKCFCIPKQGGKTDFILVAFEDKNSKGAVIDTRTQAKAFERAAELGLISWLKDCYIKKREVKVGASRLDYLLECSGEEIWVEMKSAVLREGEYAMYPDCPSLRGQKHIRELIKLREEGKRAMIVFIGALPEVRKFKPYAKGDPKIARLLKEAKAKGVEIRALSIALLPSGEVVLERDNLEVEI
ncbi:sugar/maltose fermentation stimulation protein [Thermococcus barophilus MP]|uniref:Sugar fermentation stimulation protein homolog n=1 Tax=Thermococcus barophilus (strain DSM 11836 / MP) TaxID=391623 RepID=F0LN04_THEBM|nr:sugar/maltose fermentation stimulation protein [Thermococcus barophilus MP]